MGSVSIRFFIEVIVFSGFFVLYDLLGSLDVSFVFVFVFFRLNCMLGCWRFVFGIYLGVF